RHDLGIHFNARLIREARIQRATTRHTAGHRRNAADRRLAIGRCRRLDRIPMGVADARYRSAGDSLALRVDLDLGCGTWRDRADCEVLGSTYGQREWSGRRNWSGTVIAVNQGWQP